MAGETGPRSGIDQNLGNAVSAIFYEMSQQTWLNRVGKFGEVVERGTGFASFRGISLAALGAEGYVLSIGADGVGTKIEIAERMDNHRTIGHDLIAMAVDDAVVRGGEPFAATNVFSFDTDTSAVEADDEQRTKDEIVLEAVQQCADGCLAAAKIAGVGVINGETAELIGRIMGYGPFNYDWSSTAAWLVREDRIIDETLIRPGDSIVALRERGLRSNGHTDARLAFERGFGEDWHEEEVPDKDGQTRRLGELALMPSTIYTPLIVEMTGGLDPNREPKAKVHGAAHNTGGGVPEKLGRVLRNTGFGAEISESFEVPLVMGLAQALHPDHIPDTMAYRLWNMGYGMFVVSPEPEKVLGVVREYNQNHDRSIEAKTVGEITKRPGIRIKSNGNINKGKILEFPVT